VRGLIPTRHSVCSLLQILKSKAVRSGEAGEVIVVNNMRELMVGRIDLWGNDRYLRHVHRTSLQQILPQATHEVVLGDLFGSQWINDEEFVSRVHRYTDIVFKDV
jgi:hypothetical protein